MKIGIPPAKERMSRSRFSVVVSRTTNRVKKGQGLQTQ